MLPALRLRLAFSDVVWLYALNDDLTEINSAMSEITNTIFLMHLFYRKKVSKSDCGP